METSNRCIVIAEFDRDAPMLFPSVGIVGIEFGRLNAGNRCGCPVALSCLDLAMVTENPVILGIEPEVAIVAAIGCFPAVEGG